MTPRILLVLSEGDPIAARLLERYGTPPATDHHVDGVPLRALSPAVWWLRRSVPHILDDRLDERLPSPLRADRPVLVFPSIHRSESGTACFTVHPLGNPGPTAEVGGRPRVLVPTAPRLMTAALRALAEAGPPHGLPATFEATHHGPELSSPAFFAEIGFGPHDAPPTGAVDALALVLADLAEDPRDRIAVGAGGGHYVPHFTDLALRRRWAFGHLLSRHALAEAEPGLLSDAIAATAGAEGVLFARAADAADPRWGPGPSRLRDAAAPERRD